MKTQIWIRTRNLKIMQNVRFYQVRNYT